MTTLTELLATAKPGDVIDLGGEALTNASCAVPHDFGTPVTIRNAVMRDHVMRYQKGLRFVDCHQIVTKVRNSTGQCENIEYLGGSVREEGVVTDSKGITVRESKNIAIIGVDVADLQYALMAWMVEGLVFEANRIRGTRTDAMRVQDCNGAVRVRRNDVRDMAANLSHPDALQLFQQKRLLTDCIIEGNWFERGVGSVFQGIFVKAEGGLNLIKGMIIRDNVVIGSMWNGIYAFGDTLVDRNLVIDILDARPGEKEMTAWIDVRGVEGRPFEGRLTRNTSNLFNLNGKRWTPPADDADGNRNVPGMSAAEAVMFARKWVEANRLADNPPAPEPPAPPVFTAEQAAAIRAIAREEIAKG